MNRVEAEVILRADNQRAVSPAATAAVVDRLEELGFKVEAASPLTLSISGSRRLFENIFRVQFRNDGEPSGELVPPADIAGHIEGIYVQRPPIYFDKT